MFRRLELLVFCSFLFSVGLSGKSSGEEDDEKNFNLLNKTGILNESLLTDLPIVKELKITNCDFQDMSIDAFKSMPNLKKLIILDTKIEVFPEGVLQNCPKLKEIKIKGSKIRNYDSETFANLTKLEEFEIVNSELGNLKNNMLLGCTALEEFECNHCGIQTLNVEAFNGINLKELKLKDNKIDEFSFVKFPKMSKLKSINLSGNPLKTFNITGIKETFPNLKKIKLKKTNILPETVKEIEALNIKVKTKD